MKPKPNSPPAPSPAPPADAVPAPVNLSERAALIAFSDTHINHIYGLGAPVFHPSNGEEIRANPIRRELWDNWNKFWDIAMRLTDGWPRVGAIVGDAVENDTKARSPQVLITQNPADALRMAADDVLTPKLSLLDALLFIGGTEAHTGQGAWCEEVIAQDYDHTIRDEGRNAAMWPHFYGKFGGVSFDIAHHASMGGVRRGLAGAAGRLAYDVMTAYILDWQLPPPQLVLRAHNHRRADSGLTHATRAYMLGCFQYKTAYSHRINKGFEMPNLGGVVILCERGEYQLHPIVVNPRKPKIWTPK